VPTSKYISYTEISINISNIIIPVDSFQLNSFTLAGTGLTGIQAIWFLDCRFLNTCPIFTKLGMKGMPFKAFQTLPLSVYYNS
jgi:hypothetical protein